MGRRSGDISGVADLGERAHVGWAFAERADFRARAAEFVAEGVAAGQVTFLIGAGPLRFVEAELASLGLDPAVADLVEPRTADDVYRFVGRSDVVDPARSLAAMLGAIEAALAGGATGVRAVGDATPLVRSPMQLDAFARLDHLFDRAMADLPLAALCAFDAAELGPSAVRQLACLHPLGDARSTPFRLFADEGGLRLAGTVGPEDHETFDAAVTRALSAAAGPGLVLELGDLEGIDPAGLEILERRAHRQRVALELHHARPGVAAGGTSSAFLRWVA